MINYNGIYKYPTKLKESKRFKSGNKKANYS